MERMLGCLVVSMTAGAALLHWGQPVRSATARASGTALIAQGHHEWQAIQIDAHPEGLRENQTHHVHFFVDREGRLHETENWRAQHDLDPSGVVRIGLLAPANTNVVSRVQKSAVDKLIAELSRTHGITGERVWWSDALAVPTRASLSSSQRRGTPAAALPR